MMKSPLFVSAIELLAHATELFGEKNERKYKFVILHLANAVELILKDKVLGNGVSIYSSKDQNKTIGIWDAFKKLADLDVVIPEKPIIELLIDDRNTIQHRFGFPNEEAVYFYLSGIKDFFDRFLKDEYNTTLGDELKPYLTKENIELLGISKSELDHIKKLREVSVEMAILQIAGDIERINYEIIQPYKETKDTREMRVRRRLSMPVLYSMNSFLRVLLESGDINEDKFQDLRAKSHEFREFRNQISHGRLDKGTTKRKLDSIFNSGVELLTVFKDGYEKGVYTHETLDIVFGFDQEEDQKDLEKN